MDAIEMLKRYKHNSREINDTLRSGIINSEICAMDELLSKKEVPHTLYRLIDNKDVKFDGDIFCDPAYLSCTDDIDNFLLRTDSTDYLACLEIKMDSPFSCIHVEEFLPEYDSEGEFILPRNQNLRLLGQETFVDIVQFDIFLEKFDSSIGSKELWGGGIKTISLYTLEIVKE